MIVAYDLDGVLAEGPEPVSKPWGRMSGQERADRQTFLLYSYMTARRLFDPPEESFYVITARKRSDAVGQVTQDWLQEKFPGRVRGLFLLNEARSLKNVIQFKGEVLKQIGAQEFTEDNLKVLKGLSACGAKLYHFDGLERRPVNF